MKVVSVEQMRALEAAADSVGHPYDLMMQIAGAAVAREVVSRLEEAGKPSARVVVLCGPGNNGGDGLVAARILQEETPHQISVYLLRSRPDSDPVFSAAQSTDLFVTSTEDDPDYHVLTELICRADLLVDALLGIGARLPLEGRLAELMGVIHGAMVKRPESCLARNLSTGQGDLTLPLQLVAVDCPSGLDCDSGAIDSLTLHAASTVTFAAPKLGHFAFPGAACVGELVVADIGLSGDLEEWAQAELETVSGDEVRSVLPLRSIDAHKGTYGRVLIVGASRSYTGAVGLSAMAAYRGGAGLVTAAVPDAAVPVLAASLLEPTWFPLPTDRGNISEKAAGVLDLELDQVDALVLGPGLGRADETEAFLIAFLSGGRSQQTPTVIDADGLTLLSRLDEWWAYLPSQAILTPHPGEMAQMTGLSIGEIQADRVAVARQYAEMWGCTVLLKGAFTVVAAPSELPVIIPLANDALATAGTGDVLAGLIGGLLAGGMSTRSAASSGAYLHGLAGNIAAKKLGRRSVVAGDVLNALADAFLYIGA